MAAQRKPHNSRASAADVGDRRALAVGGERSVAVVEAHLGLPGARADSSGDVGRERPCAGGEPRGVLVVPGGLDEQPPSVAVAGLGDVPAVLPFARGVLGRRQPEVAHQLARVREAPEVADLGDQPDAVWVPTPRNEHSQRTGSHHGSLSATWLSSESIAASSASIAARWERMWQSWASGSLSAWRSS